MQSDRIVADVRQAISDCGFSDRESQADPAKAVRTMYEVLGEREAVLERLREIVMPGEPMLDGKLLIDAVQKLAALRKTEKAK